MKSTAISNKRYVKLCKNSGCVSADYTVNSEQTENITLLTGDLVETSGYFVYSKTNKHNL
jgi:hypothetical protein